jgi:hypothetical protein
LLDPDRCLRPGKHWETLAQRRQNPAGSIREDALRVGFLPDRAGIVASPASAWIR